MTDTWRGYVTQGAWDEIMHDAPNVPDDTCPTIDRLKTKLGAIDFDVALIRGHIAKSRLKAKESLVDDIMTVEQMLAGVSLLVEELRTDNTRLRMSGRYWYGIARQAHTGKAPGEIGRCPST